ncbi:MAG: hypothetical protein R3A79_27045 [Nannocystaceae bacterium]
MRHLKSLLLASSVLAASGCSEEGYVTLFDENGTWVLIAHDIENTGTYSPIDSATREDSFLLYFTRTSGEEQIPGGKMAAASCTDDDNDQSPVSSACNRGFTCRCFDYTFNEATFLMKEYVADGGYLYTPEEGEPSPEEQVTVLVSEVDGKAYTYVFDPLPQRLFESDINVGSAYQFQQKADSVFEATGCLAACGL